MWYLLYTIKGRQIIHKLEKSKYFSLLFLFTTLYVNILFLLHFLTAIVFFTINVYFWPPVVKIDRVELGCWWVSSPSANFELFHHYQTCWEGISSLSDLLGGHIITIRLTGRAYHHYQPYWEGISSLSVLLEGHIITIRLTGRAYHHYQTCWEGISSLSDFTCWGKKPWTVTMNRHMMKPWRLRCVT